MAPDDGIAFAEPEPSRAGPRVATIEPRHAALHRTSLAITTLLTLWHR